MRARTDVRRTELEAELAVPPFPDGLDYLWNAFLRLARRRGGNGFSMSPITWSDIDAFVRLSGVRFSPWEIEIIESLDELFIQSRHLPET